MKNLRKHRDIKFKTTESRKKYLVSEPKYHTTKLSTEYLLVVETRKNSNISSFRFINVRSE